MKFCWLLINLLQMTESFSAYNDKVTVLHFNDGDYWGLPEEQQPAVQGGPWAGSGDRMGQLHAAHLPAAQMSPGHLSTLQMVPPPANIVAGSSHLATMTTPHLPALQLNPTVHMEAGGSAHMGPMSAHMGPVSAHMGPGSSHMAMAHLPVAQMAPARMQVGQVAPAAWLAGGQLATQGQGQGQAQALGGFDNNNRGLKYKMCFITYTLARRQRTGDSSCQTERA